MKKNYEKLLLQGLSLILLGVICLVITYNVGCGSDYLLCFPEKYRLSVSFITSTAHFLYYILFFLGIILLILGILGKNGHPSQMHFLLSMAKCGDIFYAYTLPEISDPLPEVTEYMVIGILLNVTNHKLYFLKATNPKQQNFKEILIEEREFNKYLTPVEEDAEKKLNEYRRFQERGDNK